MDEQNLPMGERAEVAESIDQQVAALRRELKLIWDAHEREHLAHEQAHSREHDFSQKAVDTAAVLAKENKADANEWRAAMDDRESRFATKSDIGSILTRLDKIERADLVTAERESQRMLALTASREEDARRTSRSQWMVGLVVGMVATFGSILINLLIR